MDSSDILEQLIKIRIGSALQGKGIKPSDDFKPFLYEYTTNFLEDSEENRIVVDDLRYLFPRLNKQFSSLEEKEAFYDNYVRLLLSEYSALTRTLLSVVKERKEDGEPPFEIVDGTLSIDDAASSEETALWLFSEYEARLKEKSEEKGKQKVKRGFDRFKK